MQVTRELFNQVMVANCAPAAANPIKGQDSCLTQFLEHGAMQVSPAKNQVRLTAQEKFKSSYEDIFSDVVTQSYVRGYN